MCIIASNYGAMKNDIIQQAVNQYGANLFIYDGNKIEEQIEKLTRVFSVSKLRLNYACKALTNPSIMELMRRKGLGIDAVSIGEIHIALEVGFEPRDIIFTPSGVSNEEIGWAIQKGVRINVDNMDALQFISNTTPNYPISIRFNPDIMAGGNANISVGHKDSKFGILSSELPQVLEWLERGNLNIEGVHLHTGSDILDGNVFVQGVEFLLEIARHFDGIKFIDLGSGFKVAYSPTDKITNLDFVGHRISVLINAYEKELGREIQLEFEPGKFLVSEAGVFVTKINTIKRTQHKNFMCLDSGFNHMVRPMFYQAYHQIDNISSNQSETEVYEVVGYLCETDTFAEDREFPLSKADDIIVFRNAGAYCSSMSSNYNSRLKPSELLYYQGELRLIRKADTLTDLTRNYINIFQRQEA